MHVGVREPIPAPLSIASEKETYIIVIAATLGIIALFSSLLRIYIHGKVTHSFAMDDFLALAAALCMVGALVTFARLVPPWAEVDQWGNSTEDSEMIGPWFFSLALIYAFGICMVKLSAALYMLRILGGKYCQYLLKGVVVLLITFTLEWYVSTILRCAPVAAIWDPMLRERARCMSPSTHASFVLINNAINTATDLLLAALIIPIACGSSLSLKDRAFIIIVACTSFIACAAAVVQTYQLFASENTQQDTTSLLWRIIELSTALIAVNLPTLIPLVESCKASVRKRQRPTISPPRPCIPSVNDASYRSRYSSQTVIYRPNTTCAASLARFHDDESNLDFDIETPATRTRTNTMRTRGTHSRNVSDWSQFSGFTYYTNATEPPALVASQSRSAGASLTELEEIIKSLGLGKTSECGLETRLAISAMNDGLPHERDDRGEETSNSQGDTRDHEDDDRADSSEEEYSVEGSIRRPDHCKIRKM